MELIKRFIVLIIFFIFYIDLPKSYAQKNFFKKTKYCYDNKLGWKFYCDEQIIDQLKDEQPIKIKTYSEQLLKLQNKVKELKARAVLEPTQQNVKAYMVLQQKIINQASFFSDVWRRILWKTPELDYTQKRPVSNLGKNTWQVNREAAMLNTLKNINKRYGIFFVYSTTCGFCQKYGEILYSLKKQYEIEIKGISIDAQFLPLWEKESFINQGQLEKLGINYNTVPITILYDNLNKSIIVIGYGLMTQDEVIQRIYILTQTNIGEDY